MLGQPKNLIPWILIVSLIAGCDDRATRIAREAADRQAQQNTSMADLNKEVASGTHQLVEADAKARQEIIGVHRDLQAERTRIDTGRQTLDQERREIAALRRTESLLAPAIALFGGIVLVALVLGFCWHAVVSSGPSGSSEGQLNELLIYEFLVDGSGKALDQSSLSLSDRDRHDRGLLATIHNTPEAT